jgi:hypothetical protein
MSRAMTQAPGVAQVESCRRGGPPSCPETPILLTIRASFPRMALTRQAGPRNTAGTDLRHDGRGFLGCPEGDARSRLEAWSALQRSRTGKMRSYAEHIGRPTVTPAVARANWRQPRRHRRTVPPGRGRRRPPHRVRRRRAVEETASAGLERGNSGWLTQALRTASAVIKPGGRAGMPNRAATREPDPITVESGSPKSCLLALALRVCALAAIAPT